MIAQAEAERRVTVAEKLLAAAERAYRRRPTPEHLIELRAAVQLKDESHAQMQEWRA